MTAKPFVKWVGGKGQLIEQLDELLPGDLARRKGLTYCEPFVGGGAMMFHVLGKYTNIEHVVVNDLNADLITTYKVVKEHPEELITALRKLQDRYRQCSNEESRKQMFMQERTRYNNRVAISKPHENRCQAVGRSPRDRRREANCGKKTTVTARLARGASPTRGGFEIATRDNSEIEVASLFIFLNRTCFNGMYRVNSKGKYNVPFGKAKNPLICDEETIRLDSTLLQKVEFLSGDFECVADHVKGDVFFYFDPPYRPLTQTASFTAYAKDGFNDEQQRRLAAFCRKLDKKGCRWLLSNSDPHNSDPTDDFFDALYDGFDIHRVSASRMINADATKRGKISELAIRNYRE